MDEFVHDMRTKKKEVRNNDLHPRKALAEVHGNRTHLPPYSDGTPDLKSFHTGPLGQENRMVDTLLFQDVGRFQFFLAKTYSPTYSPKRLVKIFVKGLKF